MVAVLPVGTLHTHRHERIVLVIELAAAAAERIRTDLHDPSAPAACSQSR
jgi:hypothetical protein